VRLTDRAVAVPNGQAVRGRMMTCWPGGSLRDLPGDLQEFSALSLRVVEARATAGALKKRFAGLAWPKVSAHGRHAHRAEAMRL